MRPGSTTTPSIADVVTLQPQDARSRDAIVARLDFRLRTSRSCGAQFGMHVDSSYSLNSVQTLTNFVPRGQRDEGIALVGLWSTGL